MFKILVVDDETSIAQAIAYALRREHYKVETAKDGLEALNQLNTFRPDVIVLDVMMPELNGYEVVRRLVGEVDRPAILLLTVKNDIVDKILGLELGADDYMTKPFDIRELIARVKALTRRRIIEPKFNVELRQERFQLGPLIVDVSSRTAWLNGAIEPLELTPKEFDLLALLARNPDRVYTREAFLEQIWDMDFSGGTRTVDIHIQRLRKKLGGAEYLIQTVFGIGYKSAVKHDI